LSVALEGFVIDGRTSVLISIAVKNIMRRGDKELPFTLSMKEIHK
jgi:hypothetical protein